MPDSKRRLQDEPEPGERPSPTLAERVAAAAGRLTPSEREVARYFDEHPEEVALLSASDLGRQTGTSDATVIRTARALGYGGLSELKAELRTAVTVRASPALRYWRTVEALGDDDARLHRLIAGQIDILAEAQRSLQPADFARAVELLTEASRVLVVGLGPLGIVADYFVMTLRRIGRDAAAMTAQRAAFADALLGLRPGDALVVAAYEQTARAPEIEAALDRAIEHGVPTVLITDDLAYALQGRYSVALTAGRGPADELPSLTVPLLIIEGLILGMVARDRPRAMAALNELNRLRRRLDETLEGESR